MNNKEENIQIILDSLDGIQRATPGPFFYTRVNARLQRERKATWAWISNMISRPVIAFSGLCIVIMINVIVAVDLTQPGTNGDGTELALSDEMALSGPGFYDFENMEMK